MFCKKSAVRNFAKFTGKYLHQSLCCNKVAGLSKNTFSYRTPPVAASELKHLQITFYCSVKIRNSIVNDNINLPISSTCQPYLLTCNNLLLNPYVPNTSIFYPVKTSKNLEDIRKPYSFLMFSEGVERVHWEQMG